MFRPTLFKTLGAAIILLSIISFEAQAQDPSYYNQNKPVSENNSSLGINSNVPVSPCVLSPGQCSCASENRVKSCKDSSYYCNKLYYGNGDAKNKYAGISNDEFKSGAENCVLKAQACFSAIVDDQAACCCKNNPSIPDIEGSKACATANTKMAYHCERTVIECNLFSASIPEKETFTKTGLPVCAWYAYECYKWSFTKSQRCSCGQNQ